MTSKARDIASLLSTANGKIASGKLDVVIDYENIVDTGTEATKIATGSTAQRPDVINAGAMRFNTTTGECEVGNGSAFRAIKNPPEISSISPSVITNAESVITITGIGFVNGAIVKFINASDNTVISASSTSFTNSTTLVSTATLTTDGTYLIQVVNPDNMTGVTGVALLTVSDAPTWNTASGALPSSISGDAYSETLSATGDSALTYSVLSGSLPTGMSLNANTGEISGTSTLSDSTNFSFTIRATDAEGQSSDRAFTLQVNVARVLTFVLHGAGGQNPSGGFQGSGVQSGTGGLVQADMTITTGTTLYIAVDQGYGSNGSDTDGGYTGARGKRAGGYAGVFLNSISHSNAQLIAGGGGASNGFYDRRGGHGGGLTGGSAVGQYAASGGSQSSGGSGGGGTGSALQGANGGSGPDCGGAGGGGYYGGGGGQGGGFTQTGSGGGGSSYIISSATNVTNTQAGGASPNQVGKVEILDSDGNQVYLKNTTGTDTYTVV